jgi:peptidoglycan/xylan/chitin deacetylase (PgdA/CDA1 family)
MERKDALRPSEPDRDEFVRDVDIIASVFNVLPLTEAARQLREGVLPPRAACVTFDDGYANNHELAAPILERAGVPATFFVTGGAIDTGVMWNDLVIEGIAGAGGQLQLDEADALPASLVSKPAGPELVSGILQHLKYLPMDLRWERAVSIYRTNVASQLPRLMMSREMVADLAARGFDVGGHTINHPILKELSDSQAKDEVESCRQWIQDVTKIAPKSFAYPNGRPGSDFDSTHAAMVAAAGFELAVSTQWDLASVHSDVFSIPRVGPWWRQNRSLAGGSMRLYAGHYLGRH